MKFSKFAMAAALCALVSVQGEARTLYVNAKRPNNKGNGLKVKTAKKTIQAAINIAKKGDTIVVYPGSYTPISTKNKKITIKAKSGSSKTTILYRGSGNALAKLGAAWTTVHKGHYVESGGYRYWVDGWRESSAPVTKGNKTTLSGFTLDGGNQYPDIGVSGGTLQSCIVKNFSYAYKGLFRYANLKRCQVINNQDCTSEDSTFSNSLFACNDSTPFKSCTFVNCTVADNVKFTMSKAKAWNTIFYKVASTQFKASKKNTLKNCYKGKTPKFVSTKTQKTVLETDGVYKTVSVPGNYRLQKGSPCINKGTKASAAKKLFGKWDLAGKKRIKGKSVDIGCYEY